MARTSQTTVLYPDTDVDAVWTIVGGTATRWEAVDEGVGSADDATTYITTTTDLAVQTLGVNDIGGVNLNENITMAVSIRYRNTSKWADDTHQLRVRLMKGTTQLSTQTINVVSTAWATSTSVASFTGTLTKAELDDLRIELMFDRTVVSMSDGAGVDVTACEVTPFSYIPRAVNVT